MCRRSAKFQAQHWGALGRCKTALGDYAQAIACHDQHYAIALKLDLPHEQAHATMSLGVVVWDQVRVERCNAVAATATGARGRSAAEIHNLNSVAKWFQPALRLYKTKGDIIETLLHLSFLAFGCKEEKVALKYLNPCLQEQVDGARDNCRCCGQNQEEDAPMLTWGGCKVARFCNEDYQRLSSKTDSVHPLKSCASQRHVSASQKMATRGQGKSDC